MTKTPAAFPGPGSFLHRPRSRLPTRGLKSVHYEADKVVTVQGRLGYQSMIEFGNGEQIENVAVGDSSAWQVTPEQAREPALPEASVRQGEDEHDGGHRPAHLSVRPQRRFDRQRRSTICASPMERGRRRLNRSSGVAYPSLLANASAAAPAVAHPKLNYDWKAKGKKELLPARTYDDGRSVYLQWKAGAPMPALYARDAEGRESLVNYRQVGAFIVIDQVPHALSCGSARRRVT